MKRFGLVASVAFAAWGVWGGAGCAADGEPEPAPAVAFDAQPADFSIAVTVLAPRGAAAGALPRARRGARYIVEPDGVLRAAVGPGADDEMFPPQTRRLTARDVRRLWALTQDAGVLAPDHPGRAAARDEVFVPVDRSVAYIEYTAGGRRDCVRINLDRADESAIGAEELVDELARLAWQR